MTTTTDLPGLAQLTHELSTAARVGNIMVRVTSDWDGGGAASRDGHGMATIEIGTDLATPAQDGVVAHEVAHLALRHGDARLPDLLERASTVCTGATVATLLVALIDPVGGRTLWIVLAATAAVLCLAAVLAEAWLTRRQEYAADAYAVLLLDAAGRPGLASMRAVLQAGAEEESRWYRLAGWLTCDHPPAARRLRRLAPAYAAAPVEV